MKPESALARAVAATLLAASVLASGCMETDSGMHEWRFCAGAKLFDTNPSNHTIPYHPVTFEFDRVDADRQPIPGSDMSYTYNTDMWGEVNSPVCSYRLRYKHGIYYQGIRAIARATFDGRTDADTAYLEPTVADTSSSPGTAYIRLWVYIP